MSRSDRVAAAAVHRAVPPIVLSRGFRRLPLAERRAALAAALGCELPAALCGDADTGAVADLLVENAVGSFPLPVGLATGFRVDGEDLVVPLATEEASVVAAASYGGRLLAEGEGGAGIRTEADPPIATVQLFVEQARDDAPHAVRTARAEFAALVDDAVASLVRRGGGFRALTVQWVGDALKVEIDLDVRDAMGANKVNTAGEAGPGACDRAGALHPARPRRLLRRRSGRAHRARRRNRRRRP